MWVFFFFFKYDVFVCLLLSKGDAKFIVRLFTYVPGKVFLGVRYSPSLVHSVGKLAGKLNAACSVRNLEFCYSQKLYMLTVV